MVKVLNLIINLQPLAGLPWPVADAISYVEMCELSEVCALTVPRLSFQRGGSARLKRLMRLKPPFRVERGWDEWFSGTP